MFAKPWSGRRVNKVLKLLLVAAMAGLMYYELRNKGGLALLWGECIRQTGGPPLGRLLAALLLAPLNLLAEVQKWYPLIRHYENIRYSDAWRAILAGSALSIITPQRLGDYGGRLLFVGRGNRFKAVSVHLAGTVAQQIILLGCGAAGVVWALRYLLHWDSPWWWATAFGALMFCLLAPFFFFHISLLERLPWPKPFKRYVKDACSAIAPFSRKTMAAILGWSLLRYANSCFQYFCLLQFFGIKTGVLEAFSCIAGIFFIQTLLPLPPVAALFARGNVAIWVWSLFGASAMGSLAVTFSLWIINLFLPAFFGTFQILCVNISKTLGYENE